VQSRRRRMSPQSRGGSQIAGYSGTPLAKKLGIKAGHTVLLVGCPRGWAIPDLPGGTVTRRKSLATFIQEPRSRSAGSVVKSKSADVGAIADVVVAFFASAAQLTDAVPGIARKLNRSSALWVAWPRRAGGHESDITDQSVRKILLPIGVVDVKVAAIDSDWSGLKFVWRKGSRPGKGG